LQALFEPTNKRASSPPDRQERTSETTPQEPATNPPSPRAATPKEQDPQTLPNHIADWETSNVGQVLANRPAKDNISLSFQVLQENISALLQEVHDNGQHPPQDTIDTIYELLVKEFLENYGRVCPQKRDTKEKKNF